MIYSVFLALLVSRCSPFDLATGNAFLKWFRMASDIIYSTLEQSRNVLNYTKLSELVAKKESSRPMRIMSVLLLLATSCLLCPEGRNEVFWFSKTQVGDWVKSCNRSGISTKGLNSLKQEGIYKLPDFVLFSQSCIIWFIHSFNHQVPIEIPLSVMYDTTCCVKK